MRIKQAIETLKEIQEQEWLVSDLGKHPTIDACDMAIRALEAWQKAIDEINKEKEDAMFKPDSDFYDGVFYALGFTLGVIDKELEKVGEQDG